MKLPVYVDHRVRVSRRHAFTFTKQASQQQNVVHRSTLCGDPTSHGFKVDPHFIDVEDLLAAPLADNHASVAPVD